MKRLLDWLRSLLGRRAPKGSAPIHLKPPVLIDDDDLDIMVRTLSGEARGESRDGKIAVAYVIRTRAEWHPPAWWGHTVGQVCLKPYQFSCWLDADWNANNKAHMLGLKLNDPEYLELEDICQGVMSGNVPDPTHGASHYKVIGEKASWDKATVGLSHTVIGHHVFFRLGPSA